MATTDWLRTNLKIKFNEFNFHNASLSEVPNRALFEDVRAIGCTSYEAYVAPIFLENRRKPWRSMMKSRAAHLSEYARQCLETQQNEMEWRLKIENDVTNRFDTEVNCTRCRAVIWRAEKDPTVATSFKTPRKDCQCRPRNKDDSVDDGLSRIFDYHADAELNHDDCIPPEARHHRKPDRVYGLRKTDRISRLLQETLTRDGDLIGEKVRSTPYTGKDEKLLFPFLVSESKAERSADNRSDAQKQSACAIITCLELQAKLADTVRSMKREDQSLDQKPLVWFLCNKGEQWYISIASFCHTNRSSIRYQVDTLWCGRITDSENALRLLLIMDYAFDWARDVYRKNVIDQLLALAANPTTTLAADTDMLTVADSQHGGVCRDFDFTEYQFHREPLHERGYTIPDLFEMFDVGHPTTAAFRDARYMVHDVLGIDITPDNFEELFLSLSEDTSEERHLSRKIQRTICEEHAWRVSAETLDAIEHLWTGFDRDHDDFRENDAKFLVNFTISSHLNPLTTNGRRILFKESHWHQRHTLKFVAVAETAIKLISGKSQYQGRKYIMSGLDVTKDEALNMFRKIRYATVRQCLAAALSSHQRMTSRNTLSHSLGGLWGDKPILDEVKRGHQTSELPVEVYRSLKTGRSEPDKSFLRLSRSPFQEHLPRENDACDWPDGTRLISENDHVVFAYASSDTANRDQQQRQSHCIFVVDPTRTITDPPSHSSFDLTSAQGSQRHERIQQPQLPRMSIFRVSPAPKVRHGNSTEESRALLNTVSSRDFGLFVEHIHTEWSRMNHFIRFLEEGYYVSDFENLIKNINLRYGPDQEAKNVVPILVDIGISLRLREFIKYLRDLTNGADLPRDEHSDKGKARANQDDQSFVPSSTNSKRNAEEDESDLPSSSKQPCLSATRREFCANPPTGPSLRTCITVDDENEDELDLPGPSNRPRSSETRRKLCLNQPTSPSLPTCITVEDEDEDRIVRLSLSTSGGTPPKTSE